MCRPAADALVDDARDEKKGKSDARDADGDERLNQPTNATRA
jgi:hypothetical protein